MADTVPAGYHLKPAKTYTKDTVSLWFVIGFGAGAAFGWVVAIVMSA